ncbi:MAG: pilus assembly protein PilM, partial [Candidatus Paceibacterota bacterium]
AYDISPPQLYNTESKENVKSVAELIAKIVHDAGIKKKEVKIIIPDSHSYSRILEMPLLTEKELISAIRYQADQFIPVPIDNVSLDIETLKEDKKEKKLLILLVASSNSIISKVTHIAESAGLIPVAIEGEASASMRLISELLKAEKQKSAQFVMYLNFGFASSSIYLFDTFQAMPLQTHNFTIGYEILQKDISANYRLDDAKVNKILKQVGFSDAGSKYNLQNVLNTPLTAIADEIKRFIVSIQEGRQMTLQNMYLFGEGSQIVGLDKQLTALTGVTITPFKISQYIKQNTVSEFFKNDWNLFIPSIGSAL